MEDLVNRGSEEVPVSPYHKEHLTQQRNQLRVNLE